MSRNAARTAANSAAFLLPSRLLDAGWGRSLWRSRADDGGARSGELRDASPTSGNGRWGCTVGTRRCSTNGAAGGVAGAAAASNETRCVHCFITFATPAELSHHAAHDCFPGDPAQVLRRFPVGAEALDTVSQQRVEILGGASNQNKAHAWVSVRELERGLVADVPISRLRLASRAGVPRS